MVRLCFGPESTAPTLPQSILNSFHWEKTALFLDYIQIWLLLEPSRGSWAHAVISKTKSGLFLLQCCLRFTASSLHTDSSRFSESFGDIINVLRLLHLHWNGSIICRVSADCWCPSLLLRNSASLRCSCYSQSCTDLLPIKLFNCKMLFSRTTYFSSFCTSMKYFS